MSTQPAANHEKRRCPHCNKPLLFGKQKKTGKYYYVCKPCNCRFAPLHLTIAAQERAIQLLRRQLDSVLEKLEQLEKDLSRPRLTVKRAKELISTTNDMLLPLITKEHCPVCLQNAKVSTNCVHCYGTGYKTNLS